MRYIDDEESAITCTLEIRFSNTGDGIVIFRWEVVKKIEVFVIRSGVVSGKYERVHLSNGGKPYSNLARSPLLATQSNIVGILRVYLDGKGVCTCAGVSYCCFRTIENKVWFGRCCLKYI